MADDDRRRGAPAPRHLEPRQPAGRLRAGRALVVELHLAFARTVAQPGEGVDDHPQTLDALQAVIPGNRRIAVHLREEIAVMRALQRRFGFRRALHRVVDRPARQHARVHHQNIAFAPGQFLLPQPVQQFVAVRRIQNLVERIALVHTSKAFGQRQQVQIVVAEHADGGITQISDGPQHGQRIRSAIDQIADKPQPVGCRVELDFIQQTQQGRVTSLKIANGIGRHIKYGFVCVLC